jgi:peptide methionine sulfoxide reductase msrA/msrB
LPGLFLGVLAAIFLWGCAGNDASEQSEIDTDGLAVATFAGGCFWCVEADFEKLPGVVAATSGYTGGHVAAPSYEQVSSGTTGHREAVRVHFDPETISYEGLLQGYWRMIDPTDADGQFGDRGEEYTTAIWYHSAAQRRAATRSKAELDSGGRYRRPIVTPILPAEPFYPAEDKHQDYSKRHPLSYGFYRYHSGRDAYLKKTWGKALRVDYRAIADDQAAPGYESGRGRGDRDPGVAR